MHRWIKKHISSIIIVGAKNAQMHKKNSLVCRDLCLWNLYMLTFPVPQFLSVSLSVNTTTHIGSVLKQNFHYHHRLFFFYLNNCWTTACLYLCFCGLYNSESRTDSRVCGTRRVHKYYRVKVLGSLYDKRLLKSFTKMKSVICTDSCQEFSSF